MLTHSKKWSWLKAWAMRVAQRRGLRRAIVALARRLGLVYVQELEVDEEVRRGELELLFLDETGRDDGVYLYSPAAMQTQPKLRAFIDLARSSQSR